MATIKLPDTIKQICFVGDIHFGFKLIKHYVTSLHLKNTAFFICGDVGLGFNTKLEEQELNFISKKIGLTNCISVCCRGNHENPECFNDTSLFKENGKQKYWLNCPDYTVINVCNKNILLVGGAVSIDRQIRILNKDYWINELPVYQPKVSEKIDIICSHSAPSFCYPNDKGGIVSYYAQNDPQLLSDIDIERSTLDKVYEDYKHDITHWYYGHFHLSMNEVINGINFRCCNCGELVYHRDKDYYDDVI